jgi:short-subunit dehydrogenase
MRVFITGATSGIGEAFARHYGQAGATLGLLARRQEMLEQLAAELRSTGVNVGVYRADVSDTGAVQRAIDDFVGLAGGADLVIANAGVALRDSLLTGNATSVANLMRINVIGATNTIVPFIPIMARQKTGTLVAVSSAAGHRGLPGRAAYSASKAALITFMDALRMTLHGSGVHAMTLCPGFIRTPMTEGAGNKLPFLLELPDAVRLMTDAIARREYTYTLPWQMNVLKHVLIRSPEWLFRRFAPTPARGEREGLARES